MIRKFFSFAALLSIVSLSAASAEAAAITPTFTTFGTLAGATFGGSGIPNDAVAITTISDGQTIITLGLTAHQRFAEPAVGNDGAGTFTALPGGYPGSPALARWNFGIYASVSGAVGTTPAYRFELLYDMDPGVGTDSSAHGVLTFPSPTGTTNQGSQNLGFGFLTVAQPGVVPPTFTAFDPNAAGEYTFALRAFTLTGNSPLGESAIRVTTVPEPSTLAIFAIGATLAGSVARRRRR